jgi:hypothetical protein
VVFAPPNPLGVVDLPTSYLICSVLELDWLGQFPTDGRAGASVIVPRSSPLHSFS